MGESTLKRLKADEMQRLCAGVQTAGGRVQVRWEADSAATPIGQLADFIEFLTLTGLWSGWQERCPLSYTSPNAPSKADVLGPGMLSILSGHRRDSHVTTIRCDGVNPGLLGMNQVISEEALRRALVVIGEPEGVVWLDERLRESTAPLLDAPWILDIDTTIKPLYGKQPETDAKGRPVKGHYVNGGGNPQADLDSLPGTTGANGQKTCPTAVLPEFIRLLQPVRARCTSTAQAVARTSRSATPLRNPEADMRRIRELEAWSTPGKLLSDSYGKDLAQDLWNLGVPHDVYLGPNAIPDQTDIENLRMAIEEGELAADDFKEFCSTHSLPPSMESADSACKFLEYSLGRRLAWIHLPEGSEPKVIEGLIAMLRARGHIVVDPDTLAVVA